MATDDSSNFTVLCSKLAKAGHAVKLSIENEQKTHKTFLKARDIRQKTETEYHKIKIEIDNMTGV